MYMLLDLRTALKNNRQDHLVDFCWIKNRSIVELAVD